MWKVIYIARNINIAKNIEKVLKKGEIAVTLRKVDIIEDGLDGNVEILVPQFEAEEAIHLVNRTLLTLEGIEEDYE